MQVWNVLHAARWKCRMQKSRQKMPSGHHRTTLSGYIFATKPLIDNRKKHVKQQYLPHMSLQYGELRPTSGWDHFGSLGHPSYFQQLPRLGSVTARHVVVGVSQTLRRWTQGATYVRQGDHHVGHWPTFLVVSCFTNCDSWKMKHTSIQHIVMTFYVNVTCKSFCQLFVEWQCSLPVLHYIIVGQETFCRLDVMTEFHDVWLYAGLLYLEQVQSF